MLQPEELGPELEQVPPPPERSAVITSEAAPTVSGEIALPPEPFAE